MNYTVSAVGNISEVGQQAWDRCANPCQADPGCGIAFDPFVSYAFLEALEASGSAVANTGWAPYHLVLESEGHAGALGVVPMYLKSHSSGEYVFDYSWADALQRAGGRYYPKLQIAVPFTPATGRRLLTVAENIKELEECLMGGIMQVAEKMGVSSVHITFAARQQWEHMGEAGFLQRTHTQYHWHNDGYDTFDDFLAALSSKKRKNIRRERRDALANGIEIELLTGSDLKEHHWDAFHRFYVDTGNRKWGTPYLTRQFFSIIGETMPDDVLLIICKRGGRYVAGAINFIGGECLFGRNWGCIEDHPFLHFEVCYYQAIEFAIERGLTRVEAGAQGNHKLARGYMPARTHSAHWIVNPSFRHAVDRYLSDERRHVQQEIDYIEDRHSPFRRDTGGAPRS
ncbi:MAG: GNAT family N-acetyltransferase [Proteobacteria bacterium]|nr:GNAT family N-acetyltransferase [Pseudomonadota bacterium]MDA1299210.1 GNAT family N-acetyltransferase [Pseudomonadota bacterium]